jgi:hypothetical protein
MLWRCHLSCSHLEVSMECECAKAKPLYAPNVHYRDPKNYSMSVLGKNRQQVMKHMIYFDTTTSILNLTTGTFRVRL